MTRQLWFHQGPFTKAQFRRRKEARLVHLEARTKGRSGQSVTEAVEMLKALLGIPECRDLDASFCWHLDRDGAVSRREYGEDLLRTPPDNRYFSEHRLLRLSARGIFISSERIGEHGYNVRDWKPVSENQYPEFVRRFQIFPSELEEIRRLITAN